MTLIATTISQQGIIHASDSNLTSPSGAITTGKKVFRLGFVEGAVSVAGAYGVNRQPMDAWMQSAIDEYARTDSPTLQGFAEFLKQRLTAQADPSRRSLLHVAGYVEAEEGARPEFYFVRNIDGMNPDGSYGSPKREFDVSEDFWTRDYQQKETTEAVGSGGAQLYFNGFPDGRIAYLAVNRQLQDFYRQVWSRPGWRFRAPRTLDELAGFVELDIRAICTLFQSSDYPSAYIGGEVQVEKIPAPANAVSL